MNKYYPIKEVKSAWLMEIYSDRSICGIKNILGITVTYHSENLFYSILDDCFFRILPFSTFPPYDAQEQIDFYLKHPNQVFVEIYKNNDSISPVWLGLYDKFKKDFLTKEELIASSDIIPGYYSDFDYILETETGLDYKDESVMSENIVCSEVEYLQKKGRPIAYDSIPVYESKGIQKIKL